MCLFVQHIKKAKGQKSKAQPTKKERRKRITNRHTAKSRRQKEIGSNDPRRDSKARAAKATPKQTQPTEEKQKKRKTSSHIAKPRRGVEIGSNNPRRSSKAKATPKSYLYIRTKPGQQKATKPKLMADRAKTGH